MSGVNVTVHPVIATGDHYTHMPGKERYPPLRHPQFSGYIDQSWWYPNTKSPFVVSVRLSHFQDPAYASVHHA